MHLYSALANLVLDVRTRASYSTTMTTSSLERVYGWRCKRLHMIYLRKVAPCAHVLFVSEVSNTFPISIWCVQREKAE